MSSPPPPAAPTHGAHQDHGVAARSGTGTHAGRADPENCSSPCISSWGHDFRPDYLRLGQVIDELGHPVVIALTATAAPPVQAEIAERLHLRDHKVIVHGFDRPNIHLAVERPTDGREKDGMVLDRATALSAGHRRGVRAAAYHAGLRRDDRDDVQERFMAGDVDVVVATTAFGMGIDKPDVRFVLHGDVADSVDSYHQEIGRAGRDGKEAEATLYYRATDLGLRRFLGAGDGVKPAEVEEVVTAVDEAGGTADVGDVEDAVDLSRRKLTLALTRLEDDGAVDLNGHQVTSNGPDPAGAGQAIEAHEERRRQVEAGRLEMMLGCAETLACRRRFLVTYFGERHGHWGRGRVVRVEGDTVTVLFDEIGYKTLSAELSTADGLLEVIG